MHAVLAQGAARPTHEEIARVAGVNRRTVANVIRDVGSDRLLVGGRPAALGPGLGLALGIGIGFETVRGGLVDANGTLHHGTEEPSAPGQLQASPDELLARVRSVATTVLRAALDDSALWARESSRSLRMLGVSVAWPCPVDRDRRPGGTVLGETWRRRSHPITGTTPTLVERLAAALGPPFSAGRCHALNDANANALCVAFDDSRSRAGEEEDSRWGVALVVRIGGGLGAGTVALAPHTDDRLSFIDSRLIEGANGYAGELGHLSVERTLIDDINKAGKSAELSPMPYDDWVCSCSQKHHLEVFASGTALERRLAASGYVVPERGPERDRMIRAALDGVPDELQKQAVRDLGRVLGHALAGPILMLDPDSITITGSLANEHLVEGIRRERDAWDNAIGDRVDLRCRGGRAGSYAGVRGAALAIIRGIVYRGFLDMRRSHRPNGFDFGPDELDALRAFAGPVPTA